MFVIGCFFECVSVCVDNRESVNVKRGVCVTRVKKNNEECVAPHILDVKE